MMSEEDEDQRKSIAIPVSIRTTRTKEASDGSIAAAAGTTPFSIRRNTIWRTGAVITAATGFPKHGKEMTMKNTYSIAQRNALVEEYLPCIDAVMRRYRRLIRENRLDPEDVYQQLALQLIKAVGSYDPENGKLETHVMAQLRYELLNCKSSSRRFGITDAPSDVEDSIISLEAYRSGAERYDAALAA